MMDLLDGRIILDDSRECDNILKQFATMGYNGAQITPHSPAVADAGLYQVAKLYGGASRADLEAMARHANDIGARVIYTGDEDRWSLGEFCAMHGAEVPPPGPQRQALAVQAAKQWVDMRLNRIGFFLDACPNAYVGEHWDHRGGRGICGDTIRCDWDYFVHRAPVIIESANLSRLFLHTANWGHRGSGTAQILIPYVGARMLSLGQPWGMYLVGQEADAEFGQCLTRLAAYGARWATTYGFGPQYVGTGDEYGFATAPAVWNGTRELGAADVHQFLPDPRIVVRTGGLEKQAQDPAGVSDSGWMTETSAPWKLEEDGLILGLSQCGIIPLCTADTAAVGYMTLDAHLSIPAADAPVSARAAHLHMDLSVWPGARLLNALVWASEELPTASWRDLLGMVRVRLDRCWARYYAEPGTGIPPGPAVEIGPTLVAIEQLTAVRPSPPPPPPSVDWQARATAAEGKLQAIREAGGW